MKISEKEFSKYARPRFLTISRLFIYMFAIILLLGVYNTVDVSESLFIHFYIMSALAIIGLGYDVMNGLKKVKTYKEHSVQFMDEYILYTDQRGSFKIKYSQIKSYQLLGAQLMIKLKWNRLTISGKLYGINYDELRQMVDFLSDKNIPSKANLSLVYYIGAFLLINYGSQYLFVNLFAVSEESSMFLILYVILFIVFGAIGFERYQINTFKMKED